MDVMNDKDNKPVIQFYDNLQHEQQEQYAWLRSLSAIERLQLAV